MSAEEAQFDIDVRRRVGRVEIAARIKAGPGLTALVGPSGAGKSTVLNMVAGVLRPNAGHVSVAGRILFDAGTGVNVKPEHRRCGYIFQDGRLFPHMTVEDNLAYGAKLARDRRGPVGRDTLMDALGIAHLLRRRPSTLSGGEAQRVAIGRALLACPDFLLMDEPLSSLDSMRKAGLIELIAWVRDTSGLPILLVSHDPREIDALANHIVELPTRGNAGPGRGGSFRTWWRRVLA